MESCFAAARDAKDWKAVSTIFAEQKRYIHRSFNMGKNASLCVDFSDGQFPALKDVVDLTTSEAMAELNAYFLKITEPHVHLLKRLAAHDLDIQGDAVEFVRCMEELRAKMPDDPEGAMSIAFQEMHDRAIAKRAPNRPLKR